MKRTNRLIIGINIVLVLAILVTLFFYYRNEIQTTTNEKHENFAATVNAMEHVAINGMERHQAVCDSWAAYINANRMTMEEACDYVREANDSEEIAAHFIWKSDYQGLSTVGRLTNPDNYAIDYSKIYANASNGLLAEDAFALFEEESQEMIRATRGFTCISNGKNVVGFCNVLTLLRDGEEEEALLLRLVPTDILQEDFIFPKGDFADAESAIFEKDNGYYVIGNSDLKNTSFYEFIREYNNLEYPQVEALRNEIIENGSATRLYKNANGVSTYYCMVAVSSAADWVVVTFLPDILLKAGLESMNWSAVLLIGLALLCLLIVDIICFLRLNQHLEKMALSAQAASRSKTEFLSTMSHDIRTPMNAIIGMTKIARRNTADMNQVQDCLEKIDLSSNHLLTLINDILDISKIESGQLKLNPAPFLLTDEMDKVINIIRPKVQEKNQEFDFSMEGVQKRYLYGDALRLNQVFINVLSNAVKYTAEAGCIRCSLKMESLPDTNDRVRVIYTVSDNGIGMSQEFMENMYLPFSREEDGRISTVQGTGLGLAITKNMVDLMDGTITCESELGKGTTFTVTLEFEILEKTPDDGAKENGALADEDVSRLKGMKILVAEDNDMNWEVISELLSIYDISCERAENGQICVDKIEASQKYDFDLILMDIQMPVMNGLQAARRIRQSEISFVKEIPIIAMTADAFAENVQECLDAGMNGHLAKPIDMKLVLQELQKIKSKGE